MRSVIFRLVVGVAGLLSSSWSPAQAESDTDLPVGHFYTQASPAGAGYGYRISDEAGIPLWSEFRRLGGVAALGYPISRRFMLDGFVAQAMQKEILEWRPDATPPAAQFVNIFDRLHDLGQDAALQASYQVPPPFDQALFDAGKSPAEAGSDRLALLNGDAALEARYNAPGGATLFGLPTSTIVSEGSFLAIRTQRAVLQHWLQDNPGAGIQRGDVTVANAGEMARTFGLVSANAALPETITGAVLQAAPAPAPAAPPAPAVAPSPAPIVAAPQPTVAPPAPTPTPQLAQQYAWAWKSVSTPPTDCGASQVLLGWLAPHRFSCDDTDPNAGTQFISGHTLDQAGHPVAGIIVRATAYGNNYDGGSDQDGTFGIIISQSCPIENRIYNLYVIDGQGRQSSNVFTVNYSNCNIAGEFHVDFIKTGP